MRFVDSYVSRDYRFSLGEEVVRHTHYLSIPVTNGIVDYEEYYLLTASEYEWFVAHPEEARPFAERCRSRDEDRRLIQRPGWNRGSPL